jgi:hypothetical protein
MYLVTSIARARYIDNTAMLLSASPVEVVA